MGEAWTIVIGAGILTFVGTLVWWKFADQWADEEHKRFKTRKRDDEERIVVRDRPEGH